MGDKSKKREKTAAPASSVSQAAPKPRPALTDEMLWTLLAEMAGEHAKVVARSNVQHWHEKAQPIVVYPDGEAVRELLRQFAGQVAMNERTYCLDALKAALPEHAERCASALAQRGPLAYTMSFSFDTQAGLT